MKKELRPLVIELCHIAVTRNEINTRRHRARYRKNYYAQALKVLEAHHKSNSELRKLEKDPVANAARIAQIKKNMAWVRKKWPNPVKWKEMGLHQIRSLVLLATSEYAAAKHETMEFSIQTRGRVRQLCSSIGCRVVYENGAIAQIIGHATSPVNCLMPEDMQKYADQYSLDEAIAEMIKDE